MSMIIEFIAYIFLELIFWIVAWFFVILLWILCLPFIVLISFPAVAVMALKGKSYQKEFNAIYKKIIGCWIDLGLNLIPDKNEKIR